MGDWLRLRTGDGKQISAYQARPQGEIKGGLVVIQEIFGVNAHIRSIVDGFARDGYVAISPALFDRIEPGVELRYEGEDMQKAVGFYQKLRPETAILDVAAGFEQLKGEGAGTAVIGYCYGGFMAWVTATRGPGICMDPKCAIGYYAGGVGSVAEEQPSCPVLLHFGAKDTHIGPEQIAAVREAHPDVQIYVYEGAEHGFNCDARTTYNPDAAALARQRTLAFLDEHLR